MLSAEARLLTKALAEHSVVLVEGIARIQGKAARRKESMQVHRAIVLDSLHSKVSRSESLNRCKMTPVLVGARSRTLCT